MTVWTRIAVTGLLAAWMSAGTAVAQENFDAGKSGAQLYASNCAICHKSAQALNKDVGGLFGLESFLREHYTAGRESAAAIAAYLNSVGGPTAGSHRTPAKKRVKKKDEATPGTRDGKPAEKTPEEKKSDKPSGTKPDRKEHGKTAAAALRTAG
jgi:hypothetical protein